MDMNGFLLRKALSTVGYFGGVVLLSFCLSFTAWAGEASCTGIAGQKIRWVVPNSVGGGYDTYSRLIAPFYGKALGVDIFVENIKGAGGIVGSRTIKESKPDGLTIGILNGSGLMVANLAGDENAPSLTKDFTILGRIARSRHVWATGASSPFLTIEDVFKEAEKRPILFATQDLGSTSFISGIVGSHLLAMKHEIVPGYRGSGAGILAALRGEVDLVSYTFDSILDQIEKGDIRPLLQITGERISPHPSLNNVPLIGGEKGWAVRRAKKRGAEPKEAAGEAKALSALIGAGRLIAAPPGLPKDLSTCMENSLYETLSKADFQAAAAKAKRSLDLARGETARNDLQAVTRGMSKFGHVIKEAIRKIRE